VRPITHRVGASLVRGNYEEAVIEYVTTVNPLEPEEERNARAELGQTRDWAAALEDFPARLNFEKTLVYHLAHEPGDYVGALRKLPSNLVQMFVHAYQSYLFNRMISTRLDQGLPLNRPVEGDIVLPMERHGQPDTSQPIPVNNFNLAKITRRCEEGRAWVTGLLFGFKASIAKGPMGEIERDIIRSENLRRRDFAIYHLPYINSFGLRRALLCRPLHLQVKVMEMELPYDDWREPSSKPTSKPTSKSSPKLSTKLPTPIGADGLEMVAASEPEPKPDPKPEPEPREADTELGVEFAFTLTKGSYATMLLREFMKASSSTAY